MATASTKRYIALDFLRGAAALAVLIYHIGYMFGDHAPHMANGFLAVDFFFILSGFVIAANYHVSIKSNLSWIDFCLARISRLWPLFLLTTVFGCIMVIAKLSNEYGHYDWSAITPAILFNALMLPSFSAPYNIDRLFIFNGASWSIFFEILVNAIFIYKLRFLQTRGLAIITIIAATLLAYLASVNGSLDGGWSSQSFHVGLVRVFFGFSAGTLIFLVSKNTRRQYSRSSLLLLASILFASFFSKGEWLIQWACVVLVFPSIVFFAAQCELGNKYASATAGWLGDISYSIYLWQTPMMLLASGITQRLISRKLASFAPFAGFFFVLAMLILSHLSWKLFEMPAKNFFRAKAIELLKIKKQALEAAQ